MSWKASTATASCFRPTAAAWRADDLGAWWTEILKQRLQMYRGLEATTVEKFGAEHFRRWDDTYAFFVGLFAQGQLGGGRLVARRLPEVFA